MVIFGVSRYGWLWGDMDGGGSLGNLRTGSESHRLVKLAVNVVGRVGHRMGHILLKGRNQIETADRSVFWKW
jgi:hypothetical protein